MAQVDAAEQTQAAGWQAELDLRFAAQGSRTVLAQRRHSGPLRVQRPFYPEGPVCQVYLLHPPGGVVGGDELDIRVSAEPGTQVLLTTPAAGKFYRSGGRHARQTVRLSLRQAQLEWLPQETIYYPRAQVRQRTLVRLDADSRFIGWELACFGLPARGEPYQEGCLAQDFEIWLDQRPLLLDRLRLDGGSPAQAARWGLAGQAALGTFLAYPVPPGLVQALREAAGTDGLIGVSVVDGLLVCRGLAALAEALKPRFLALWGLLRPELMRRAAVAPRIWAT
jgi:urease accessory protein